MVNKAGDDLPYQELLGNYNKINFLDSVSRDLPYQELLGNYNSFG